jgi:hypothetical protein
MKKTALTVGLLVLLLSAAQTGRLLLAEIGDRDPKAGFPQPVAMNLPELVTAAGTGVTPQRGGTFRGLPGVGATITVDLEMDDRSLAGLSPRERDDQYLDWLLIAVLSRIDPSSARLNAMLFDLPPVRYGYMRPAGNFEYGPTRARNVGDGRAVALIPAAQNEGVRKDYIANVADRLRKDLGGMFETLLVFEYARDSGTQATTLHRAVDVPARDIFSAAYGYHQAIIASRVDLEHFLAQVDDITYVRRDEGGLTIAGRRLLSRHYRGIAAEHVATVWQAEHKLQAALAAFDKEIEAEEKRFEARWEGRTYSTYRERDRAEREIKAEADHIREKFVSERDKLKLVNGTGFSLDPTYDFNGLVGDFEPYAKELLALNDSDFSPSEIAEVSGGLSHHDIVPFLRFKKRVESATTAIAARLAGRTQSVHDLHLVADYQKIEQRNHFQAARYDGDLQGTEVGMILFYTDLLAKLWSSDMLHSTPARAIPGFVDDTHVELSTIYQKEAEEFPNSRLWFGPANFGFQSADRGQSLLFARTATRIYNAGSNPLNPGVEVPASAILGNSVAWWNDHYEEVAAYEQEYERLNEIMKWSIVIGWLNDKAEGDRLGFLADVTVGRSHKMPEWARSNPELKFRAWDNVAFYQAGYRGSTTETLPMIKSPDFDQFGSEHYIEGGVSLAPKALFKGRAPLGETLGTVFRRSNIDYAATDLGASRLTTLEKTVFELQDTAPQEAKLVVQLAPETKLRSVATQVSNVEIERDIVRSAVADEFELKAAGQPVGKLSVVPTPNGLRVGWKARDLDVAQALARQLSGAENPDLLLAADPKVTAYVRLSGDTHFAVKLTGSEDWVEFSSEGEPSIDVQEGWLARTADPLDAEQRMQLRIIERQTVLQAFDDTKEVVIESGNGRAGLALGAGERPAGARVVTIDADDFRVSGWADKDGKLHLPWKDLPVSLRNNPEELGRRFGSPDWSKAIATQPGHGPIRLEAAMLRSTKEIALERALESAQHRNLVRLIADDASRSKQLLDLRVHEELRLNHDLVADGQYVEALQQLDGLVEQFGPLPDLMLRRALVQLERDNLAGAVQAVHHLTLRPLHDPEGLLDEISDRLQLVGDPRTRDGLSRLDALARWTEKHAHDQTATGSMSGRVKNGRLELDYRRAEMPIGEPVGFDELESASGHGAIVYRQDSPGLNNVDWNLSLNLSLRQLISGNLGKVVKLPAGDISEFQPAVVYSVSKDGATETRWLRESHFSDYHDPLPSENDCKKQTDCDHDSLGPAARPVYVIIDKAA